MAEKPLARRVSDRSFPSVFQAWNPADPLPGASADDMLARHDLVFHSAEFFGLAWNDQKPGRATGFTPESLGKARQKRAELLKRNPNTVLIAEIRYRDAGEWFLHPEHPFWKRDTAGKRMPGWEEGDY